MTSDINLNIVASQSPASGATKAQAASAPAQTAKPDPKPVAEEQGNNEQRRELSVEQLNEAVEQLNSLAQSARRKLSFSIDDDTGRTVITVKDGETDEEIRKIPSDQVLHLISSLQEFESGLLKEMV